MKERLPVVMKWRLVREGYDVSKGLHGPAGNLDALQETAWKSMPY